MTSVPQQGTSVRRWLFFTFLGGLIAAMGAATFASATGFFAKRRVPRVIAAMNATAWFGQVVIQPGKPQVAVHLVVNEKVDLLVDKQRYEVREDPHTGQLILICPSHGGQVGLLGLRGASDNSIRVRFGDGPEAQLDVMQ